MLSYNPLLQFGFDDTGESHIFIKDDEGNEIDITEYVASLKTQIDGKVNIFQGSTNANKVLVTDPQGNVSTVSGVVMNAEERSKLAAMTNVVILKGILNSYEALYQIDNPQGGWCYFVKKDDNKYDVYVYTEEQRWQPLGQLDADKIPQYLGGVATEIDTNYRVNLLFNPDNFEIDEQNRLKLKEGQGGGGSIKYDPDYLEIDENGRLTLKYKIRIWDEIGGQGGSGGSSGSGSEQTAAGHYLKQVSDLDNYQGSNGEIVQFVGTTSGQFTKGYIYIFLNSTWQQINVQPQGSGGASIEWINI